MTPRSNRFRSIPDDLVLFARRCDRIRKRASSIERIAMDAGVSHSALHHAVQLGFIRGHKKITADLLRRAKRARSVRRKVPSVSALALREGFHPQTLAAAVVGLSYKHLRSVPLRPQQRLHAQAAA
jgi:lambda repressor-like predicted transcriptional regulator